MSLIQKFEVTCNECYTAQNYQDLYCEETYPYILYYCDKCMSPDLHIMGTTNKLNSFYLMNIYFPNIKGYKIEDDYFKNNR